MSKRKSANGKMHVRKVNAEKRHAKNEYSRKTIPCLQYIHENTQH